MGSVRSRGVSVVKKKDASLTVSIEAAQFSIK